MMILPWAEQGLQRVDGNYLTTPTPLSVTVTASATPHTVGSWAQLNPGITCDADALVIWVDTGLAASGTATGALLTIGIGAAGSEQVLVENINVGSLGTRTGRIRLPVRIARGTRIAARLQGVVASDTISLRAMPIPGNGAIRGGRGAVTYGADTGTSLGTQHTSGNAAWATPTEVVEEIGRAHRWIVPSVGHSSAGMATDEVYFQVMVGAASSEQPILDGLVSTSAGEDVHWRLLEPQRVDIPAGSRLSVRAWGVGGARQLGYCLHCFE